MAAQQEVGREVVRWQLDVPGIRARELDEFANTYGFATRKDLVNTALSLLQWAVDEVKTGRIVASVDEKNMRYKQIDLPAFKLAASHAAANPAALAAGLRSELDRFDASVPKSAAVRSKMQAAKNALDELATAVGA